MNRRIAFAALTLGMTAACAPPIGAQTTDEWKFNAVIYGYFPDIRGQSTFGAETGRDGITIDFVPMRRSLA